MLKQTTPISLKFRWVFTHKAEVSTKCVKSTQEVVAKQLTIGLISAAPLGHLCPSSFAAASPSKNRAQEYLPQEGFRRGRALRFRLSLRRRSKLGSNTKGV